MQAVDSIIQTLIANLEEAMDLAGDGVLPVTDYENDIAEAKLFMQGDSLYQKAISKWGMSFQCTMLASECAELIHAVLDFSVGREDISTLHEELADVEIMCEQMRVAFGNEQIDRWRGIKLKRLAIMLKEADGAT